MNQKPRAPLFSVLREVSKMCVGMIDSDDAHCYCGQIKCFEQSSECITVRSKNCVVKLY